MVVLVIFAVALLPVLRPTGPAGVPVLALSDAPQGIAAQLRHFLDRRQLDPGAHVWAPQVWGSFLEWAVPELRVGIDSRIELFPPPVLADADEIARAGTGWLSTLEVRHVDALILPAGANDAAHVRALQAPGSPWRLVYSDDDGMLWMPWISVAGR
jgi:hypothetical protein